MNATIRFVKNAPEINLDCSGLPRLLDLDGVNKHLAPLGHTLLYELASLGEIESVSVGLKRGKRLFVTESIVQWLQRRMATTVQPRTKDRRGRAALTERP